MTELNKSRKIRDAERDIQNVLLALENSCDLRIESVDVDCRNFSNFNVDIIVRFPVKLK